MSSPPPTPGGPDDPAMIGMIGPNVIPRMQVVGLVVGAARIMDSTGVDDAVIANLICRLPNGEQVLLPVSMSLRAAAELIAQLQESLAAIQVANGGGG